ncbi:hypothetical protein LAZ67_22000229 [Cordylochernes scorpioides]|uniref:Uncharacterized protein n=1 Tax=Cordylochernes scorpioides TaxID=51811 RepID=A0ABY6LR52_9ARAC|nr:hypothetical protein LAZ67_22000229 [Cordylochernes scorpioides]
MASARLEDKNKRPLQLAVQKNLPLADTRKGQFSFAKLSILQFSNFPVRGHHSLRDTLALQLSVLYREVRCHLTAALVAAVLASLCPRGFMQDAELSSVNPQLSLVLVPRRKKIHSVKHSLNRTRGREAVPEREMQFRQEKRHQREKRDIKATGPMVSRIRPENSYNLRQ